MDPAETREALAHWQFTDPNDRLAHLVKDATKSLLRGLQRRLAEHNVLFGHWAFLRILWEQEGLTQRELNERAGLMEPTTYSALKAMESLGYIKRRHLRDNRKNLHIYLTDAGRDLQHKLVPLAEEVNTISTRGLRDDEVATCRKVLWAIVVNMASDEAAAESVGQRMPRRGSSPAGSRKLMPCASTSARVLGQVTARRTRRSSHHRRIDPPMATRNRIRIITIISA